MHAIVDPGSADTPRKVIHAGGTVAEVRHAKQRDGTSERLSIVMPVYNEAAVIEDVVDELRREVADHFDDAELVLVNDASTDDTASILDQLAAADSRLRIVHAERNGGHGPALRRALDESSGDWIFQIDSDGQQVGAEFWQLWERRVGAGLVMGMRVIRRNGWHRLLVSAVARYLNRMIGGGDIRDVNVPFKLISRTLWEDVAPYIPREPVAPSLLVAVGAGVRQWQIVQIPITHKARPHGPSTVNLRALFRLGAGALSELVAYRVRLARDRKVEQPAPRRSASTAPHA